MPDRLAMALKEHQTVSSGVTPKTPEDLAAVEEVSAPTAIGRVLVVDDDRLDQLAIQSALQRDLPGCLVDTVGSVSEARQSLERGGYTLALVDYYLGDGLGLELIAAANETPVVVITGAGNEACAVEAMHAGAYDYVVKDVQSGYLNALAATIQHALDRKRAELIAAERTAELATAYRELEQFAHVVSHDLQAPLRSIKGFIGILREDIEDALDDSARDYMERIDASASRMDRLIRELLDYSRVGRTGDEIEPVDTQRLVADLSGDLEALTLTGGGEIVVENELPWVEGVPVRLRQLFQNLVGNALKFRGEQAPVVRVGAREQGRRYEFYVADNGIGIDPEDFDTVFRVFSRVGRTNDYEGTGIGLSTCKKIVEQHGGRIRIESALEQGTTFFFSLPRHDRDSTQ